MNYSKENEKEITDYLSENNLTESAVRTDSGLYYIIKEEGTGETPTDTSIVTVNYKGYFTDEEIFDEKDNKVFNLSSETLIQGWKEGIPYFKEGGKGKLFIPSRLGLKNGSVLIFDIDLITINN
nr:FKBP-type peptidyl-prolyl cis-trans isomerase [Wenyingzhuangia fucanilytica]